MASRPLSACNPEKPFFSLTLALVANTCSKRSVEPGVRLGREEEPLLGLLFIWLLPTFQVEEPSRNGGKRAQRRNKAHKAHSYA